MTSAKKLTLTVGFLAAAFIHAQPAPIPKFEVVSIRPCGEDAMSRGLRNASPGTLNVECVPVFGLIYQSYVLFASGKMSAIGKGMTIEGGPDWIKSERYTVEAKAEGTPTQSMMIGPMMQTVLEDRFKLKYHRETRQVPVYTLTVAKEAPKLPASREGSCFAGDPDHTFVPPPRGQPLPPVCRVASVTKTGLDVRAVTMADFCLALSAKLDRPVIDRTGITGMFDIHVDISPADLALFPGLAPPPPRPGNTADPGAPPPVSPDPGDVLLAIRSAVQKIGLKLEAGKGPGEFLVIDHVERPSEN